MENNQLNSPNSLHKGFDKVKKIANQLSIVRDIFFDEPCTMKEADILTGIMRESICWYCRSMRKQNSLYPIGKRFCRVTKHKATVYTTDPAKAINNSPQLKLF